MTKLTITTADLHKQGWPADQIETRVDELRRVHAEGRLLRGAWTRTDEHGRHLACLLVALAPECSAGDADACPAWLMPPWLAHLLPWLDDAGSEAAWPGQMARLIAVLPALLRRLAADPEAARRLDYAVRAIAVREAMRHTRDAAAIAACETVAALCETMASGGAVTEAQWAVAAETAARAWARAAKAAETAAAAAVWAAARAAVRAAGAAADRMIGAILSAFERAVGGAS